MAFVTRQLDNGLVLIGEVNPSAESAAVGFFVRAGARDETLDINGVSHFLEHMLFKGTQRLSPFEVNEAFDRTGAQFNAFTSEECTVYYAAVLPEYLEEVTRLWIELMRPALREEDFAIEKNVIKEEIAMYLDMPSFDVMDRCRSLHFGEHPCANSVLGSVQSIDALSAAQMRGYFNRRYNPNNLVFACTGNFDPDRIFAAVEQGCSGWPAQTADRATGHCPGSGRRQRIEKANLVREHICLMSEGVAAQDSRRFAAHMLACIIGDCVGSRFYWELVDTALADEASMQFSAMDGTGVFCSYISCAGNKLQTVYGVLERVFADLAAQGVTEDELTMARNKVLSTLVLKNEVPMGRLVDLGFNWVYLGRYCPIEQDVEAIKAVTVEEVVGLIHDLRPGRFTCLTLGPPAGSPD